MSLLRLSTGEGCGLVIGAYPPFRYDARGGGGLGELGPANQAGLQALEFDPTALPIPPLTWRTTRFLGLPLPPGLSIAIEAEQLAGSLDSATGTLALHFKARFHFAIGSVYRAPALQVDTQLSSGAVSSRRHQRSGSPWRPMAPLCSLVWR
ncbi:hypothetical protein [Cyanobium sp. ATX-6F1]|uniref:hypothetical protein n=1 Tax=Cyanobium sp. ATX-6F1 TaxID=3137388 RepID=UPI0039BE3C65